MPIHMEGAVAPAAACPAKVSHRKAPGAMSAIAFIVRPVRPRVDFISTGAFSAIIILLSLSSVVVPLVWCGGGRPAYLRAGCRRAPFALPHTGNSKQKPQLDHAARLAGLGAERAKGQSGRDVAGADVRNVGACEDLFVLVGRRQGERPRRAARTVHQVRRLRTA